MAPLILAGPGGDGGGGGDGSGLKRLDLQPAPPAIYGEPPSGIDGAASEEDVEMASTAERVQEVAISQAELRGQQAVLATRLDHVAEKVEVIDARGERLESRCAGLDGEQRKQGEQLARVAEVTGRIPAIEAQGAATAGKVDQVLQILGGLGLTAGGPGGAPGVGGAGAANPLLGLLLKGGGATGVIGVLIYLLLQQK